MLALIKVPNWHQPSSLTHYPPRQGGPGHMPGPQGGQGPQAALGVEGRLHAFRGPMG